MERLRQQQAEQELERVRAAHPEASPLRAVLWVDANAVVALGCTPAEMSWKAGVEVLSFGATKNGALGAEAVIIFNKDLADTFAFRRKRSGHLFSKMRLLSAQMEAYLSDELWRYNAEHANAMARYLSEGLQALPGVSLMFPTQANSVFVELPPHAIEALKAKGWTFYTFIGAGGARFVCAWNTTVELLDQLLADVKAVLDVRA